MAHTIILSASGNTMLPIFVSLKKISMKSNLPSVILILVTLIALFSCGSNKANDPQPGTPIWTTGYPAVPYGAQTADIVLQADKKSTAYWVISEKAMTLTPEQLKDQVVGTTDASVKFKGKSDVDANTLKTE